MDDVAVVLSILVVYDPSLMLWYRRYASMVVPLVIPHQLSFTGTVEPIVVPVTNDGRGPSTAGYDDGARRVTTTVAVATWPPPSAIVYWKTCWPVVQPIGS